VGLSSITSPAQAGDRQPDIWATLTTVLPKSYVRKLDF
jgi:hypothetical protein